MLQFPFNQPQYTAEQQAQIDRGREIYESNYAGDGGYAHNFKNQSLGRTSFSEEDRAALRAYTKTKEGKGTYLANRLKTGGLFGRQAPGSKGRLVKLFKGYLRDQGFSAEEQLKFFQALDADPKEFFGSKGAPKETKEQIRFLKEYFKEGQDLYQATADTEREMVREEKASREQAEFDKAQREAFGLSEEQQGELADRQRKQQQSQQYLQSRGGMTSRQAQKSGMVMIPQARPV